MLPPTAEIPIKIPMRKERLSKEKGTQKMPPFTHWHAYIELIFINTAVPQIISWLLELTLAWNVANTGTLLFLRLFYRGGHQYKSNAQQLSWCWRYGPDSASPFPAKTSWWGLPQQSLQCKQYKMLWWQHQWIYKFCCHFLAKICLTIILPTCDMLKAA